MPTNAAHTSWWQTFEVVFGVPFLAAIALQLAIPFSVPIESLASARLLVGCGFIVLGITIVVLARREFAHHHQPTDPGAPTSKLVTTGVFSFSRNPLYLGGACVLGGISLVANLLWGLVLLLPSLTACHYILILPEERFLTAKFGEEYAGYAASVRRWLGRASSKSDIQRD